MRRLQKYRRKTDFGTTQLRSIGELLDVLCHFKELCQKLVN